MFIPGGRTGFLLIHGMSGTPVEMRYIVNGLVREGYTVACPQLAGHCRSVEELKATSWRDWLASVEAALDQLRECCDHVFVGGLSMGAVLAMKVAARNPDIIRGTVLYSPTLWLDGWSIPPYGRLFRLVRHKWFANLLHFSEQSPYGIKDVRLRQLIADALNSGDASKAGFLSIPGGLLLELRWLVNSVKEDLCGIKQPVLIVHPRDDDRASLSNAVYLERKLGGRVETVVLEDSYHIVTLDRQRDLVLGRTTAFAAAVMSELNSRRTPAVVEAIKPSAVA
ncbi:MAG: alpha/beta hydrolase [Hyphomicrobiaceae bacterium]